MSAPSRTVMSWSRLIRFVDESGGISFGDPCIENSSDLIPFLDQQKLYAVRLMSSDAFALTRTSEKVRVKSLVGVLNEEDVKIVKCIGYVH